MFDAREVAKLQEDWVALKESGKMTKRAICDLVIPFRNRHGLTDMVALEIAKGNMSLSEMVRVMEGRE